jgi:hypothetical protein
MGLLLLIFLLVLILVIVTVKYKKQIKLSPKRIVKQHEINGSQIKTIIEPISKSNTLMIKKPEMSAQNKWLNPQDDLGELERGIN